MKEADRESSGSVKGMEKRGDEGKEGEGVE